MSIASSTMASMECLWKTLARAFTSKLLLERMRVVVADAVVHFASSTYMQQQ